MSEAKKCDICFKYYDKMIRDRKYRIQEDAAYFSSGQDYTKIDLCEDCYEDLEQWINKKKKNP